LIKNTLFFIHLNEKVINRNVVDNSQYNDYHLVIEKLVKHYQWVSGSEIVCSKDDEQ
jgi:hypothetical protein